MATNTPKLFKLLDKSIYTITHNVLEEEVKLPESFMIQ